MHPRGERFVRVLEAVEEAGIFGRAGLVLHGATQVQRRRALVQTFQEDEDVPFLILSLKAGGTGHMTVPVCCYLIVHPKGTAIFDTGLHLITQTDQVTYMGAEFYSYQQRHFAPGEEISAQLEAMQIDPGSINYVINSHLHFDHAGGLLSPWRAGEAPTLLFPNARFVVGRAAWERAVLDQVTALLGAGQALGGADPQIDGAQRAPGGAAGGERHRHRGGGGGRGFAGGGVAAQRTGGQHGPTDLQTYSSHRRTGRTYFQKRPGSK